MEKAIKKEDIFDEVEKCRENPYYFATTYLTIKNSDGDVVPYTTHFSEERFNEIFNSFGSA